MTTSTAPAPIATIANALDDHAEAAVQRHLARANQARFDPALPRADWLAGLEREHALRLAEAEMIERRRSEVADEAAAAPRAPEAFLGWFASLRANGPGQGDPLHPWLAEHATWPQLRWFLHQEVAGEAGFDDLVAMTQVKLPERAKLELARNYWDEMGRGTVDTMHGRMLRLLAVHLELQPTVDDTVWESLTLSNLMIGLAANRRYAWHSVGALGVIELTAPTRVGHVDAALMRHGFPADLRRYFTVHAVLDVKHSQAWNAEVIAPAVARDPAVAIAIAEGALMRLRAGAHCFARYRAELGAPG